MQHFHDIIQVIQYITGFNSDNCQPKAIEKNVTIVVVFGFVVMRFSVNFNNNIAGAAIQINDKIAYYNLSIKIKPFEFTFVQSHP